MLRNRRAILLGLVMAGTAAAQSSAPAPAGEDWGSEIVDWTNQAVTAYGGLLLDDGMKVLAWAAALKVLWVIFRWAVDRALSFSQAGHYPFPIPQVAMVFAKLAFLVYLLNHYMVNFPFVGFSFHNFPMAVSKHIVLLLQNSGTDMTDVLMGYLQTPSTVVTAPLNPLAIVDGLVYLAVHAWCGLLSFGMFVLGGLGFVLSGVLVVVGPIIFVLWMLGGVPGQWAWNWFNALMAVGSYRALGEVMKHIMSQLWVHFIQSSLNNDTSIANWIAHGGICVGLTLFFLLGMTLIPLFAGTIFCGAATFTQAGANAVTGAVSGAVSAGKAVAAAL
jgi:hypothetical protein